MRIIEEKCSFSKLIGNVSKGGNMGLIAKDDGGKIPDAIWEEIKQIIPKSKDNHPLGCHRKRIDDRKVMDGIFFVLRTGCQWQALDNTNICKHSVAHKRFQEWAKEGVFLEFWWRGLVMYDEVKGLGWDWVSLDGAMTKSPLGGEKTGANPTDRAKKGTKRSLLTDQNGIPISVEVAGANINDFKLTKQTFENICIKKPKEKKI